MAQSLLVAVLLTSALSLLHAVGQEPVSADKPSQAGTAQTTGPNGRVAARAFFPMAVYVSVRPPAEAAGAGENAVAAYCHDMAKTLRDMGFNTLCHGFSEENGMGPALLRTARDVGMKSIVQPTSLVELVIGKKTGSADDVRAEVRKVAAAIAGYDNVIACILHADPVDIAWLDTWKVLGPAFVAETGGLPALTSYWNAYDLKRFNDVAPVGAYQFFAYPFNNSRRDDPLAGDKVMAAPNPDEVRRALPDLPAWPYIQCMRVGKDLYMPSASEVEALCYLCLAHGARGLVFYNYSYAPPDSEAEGGMSDAQGRPAPMLRELSRALPDIAKIGTVLLDCTIVDGIVRCPGKGDAAYYENNRGDRYLLVASWNVKRPATLKVVFEAARVCPKSLEDVLTGEKIACPGAAGKSVTVSVTLPAIRGRLFKVTTAD
jgi:hypothetical protein